MHIIVGDRRVRMVDVIGRRTADGKSVSLNFAKIELKDITQSVDGSPRRTVRSPILLARRPADLRVAVGIRAGGRCSGLFRLDGRNVPTPTAQARDPARGSLPDWNRHDGRTGAGRARGGFAVGDAFGVALIGASLLLTLYLSVFDEKLILFPPHAYTLDWYGQIPALFGAPIWTSLKLGIAATIGSLLLGVPAGIGLSRHRFRGRTLIGTLLLAPITVPGIALGLAVYIVLVALDTNLDTALTGSLTGLVFGARHDRHAVGGAVVPREPATHDRQAEEAAASLGPIRCRSSGGSRCRRCIPGSSPAGFLHL